MKRLRAIISRRPLSNADLSEAAVVCRSLALSDQDGSGAFYLFSVYFVSLLRESEGGSVDAVSFDKAVNATIPCILECLDSLEEFDLPKLIANLDSFAREALKHKVV